MYQSSMCWINIFKIFKNFFYIFLFSNCFFLVSCSSLSPIDSKWDRLLTEIRTNYPDVGRISASELNAWFNDPARQAPLLLDVRSDEEFMVSHLKNAVQADSPSELDDILKGLNKNAPIVVYCSVGYRSAEVVRQMQSSGYANVKNFEGSIFQWANQGRPVYLHGEVVNKVHPYDDEWDHYLNSDYYP